MFARQTAVLPEEKRMQKLSVNAYIQFKELYDELKSQNKEDAAFTLASMCSQGVIRELINNEKLLVTNQSTNWIL